MRPQRIDAPPQNAGERHIVYSASCCRRFNRKWQRIVTPGPSRASACVCGQGCPPTPVAARKHCGISGNQGFSLCIVHSVSCCRRCNRKWQHIVTPSPSRASACVCGQGCPPTPVAARKLCGTSGNQGSSLRIVHSVSCCRRFNRKCQRIVTPGPSRASVCGQGCSPTPIAARKRCGTSGTGLCAQHCLFGALALPHELSGGAALHMRLSSPFRPLPTPAARTLTFRTAPPLCPCTAGDRAASAAPARGTSRARPRPAARRTARPCARRPRPSGPAWSGPARAPP